MGFRRDRLNNDMFTGAVDDDQNGLGQSMQANSGQLG
jgi:hypothetical protein